MSFSLTHGLIGFTILSVLIGVFFTPSAMLLAISSVLLLVSTLFGLALAVLLEPGQPRRFFVGFSVLAIGSLLCTNFFSSVYEPLANGVVVPLIKSRQSTASPMPTMYTPLQPLPSAASTSTSNLTVYSSPPITTVNVAPPAISPTNAYPVIPATSPSPYPVIPMNMLQPARSYLLISLAFILGLCGGIMGVLIGRKTPNAARAACDTNLKASKSHNNAMHPRNGNAPALENESAPVPG